MKTTPRIRRRPRAGIFGIAASSLLVLAASAGAATFTVNDIGDASDQTPGNGVCATAGAVCTLRAAIEEANALAGDDTIVISVAGTLLPLSAYPAITTNLVIDGPGEGVLGIDASDSFRPFFVDTGAAVTIRDLTLDNGRAAGGSGGSANFNPGGGGGGAGMGGAIFQNGGSLTLRNVTVDSSSAIGGAGGGASGSGTTFGAGGGGFLGAGGDGNSGTGGSGGLLGAAGVGGQGGTAGGAGATGGFGGGGGGGAPTGTGGSGGAGGFGGGGGGGGLQSTGANAAGGFFGGRGSNFNGGGGGGAGLGGAIFVRAGTLTLSNVNLTNNTATRGAAAPGFGAIDGQGKGGAIFINISGGATLNVTTSGVTFSGNTADDAVGAAGDTNDLSGAVIVPVEVSGFELD